MLHTLWDRCFQPNTITQHWIKILSINNFMNNLLWLILLCWKFQFWMLYLSGSHCNEDDWEGHRRWILGCASELPSGDKLDESARKNLRRGERRGIIIIDNLLKLYFYKLLYHKCFKAILQMNPGQPFSLPSAHPSTGRNRTSQYTRPFISDSTSNQCPSS